MTLAELAIVLVLFAGLLWALGPLRHWVGNIVARMLRRPVARVIRGDFHDTRETRDLDEDKH